MFRMTYPRPTTLISRQSGLGLTHYHEKIVVRSREMWCITKETTKG